MPIDVRFVRPTSVVVYGTNRPLVNWTAYALASASDPGFVWTDLRLPGEVLTPEDVLARGLIPPDRLNVVSPEALTPSPAGSKAALARLLHENESEETLRRLVDFLRLPPGAQRLLARGSTGRHPLVLVLSNAHRAVALWPAPTVAPMLEAIVGAGATFLMTFVDAPSGSHRAFDTILDVEGDDPRQWKRATLKVKKGGSEGPLRTGDEHPLRELSSVARILDRELA